MHILARLRAIAILLCCVGSVAAADLRIGFKAELTSADPHVLNGANRNVWVHVYDSLVFQDAQLRPIPGLALSWHMLSPKAWEFKLRPGVPFQNGTRLSAEDVKYSIERAMGLQGPRTFRAYLRDVARVWVKDPLTVVVETKRVSPTLPENVGMIAILPASLGKVDESDFASGQAAIGSGPYKFASWSHGQKLVLVRNDNYWGAREPWASVTLHFVPREPARAAALLSGSVDIVNDVTTHMEHAFRGYRIVSETSYMLNYLSMDQFRKSSPFVSDGSGRPLPDNPLQSRLVRQALGLAIDRQALVRHVMKRDGVVSQQLVPSGFVGHDDGFRLAPHDRDRARALLAQAGYPDGFRLTIHCTNNRYLNDAKVCEAVAQMFTRVGVRTAVSTMPFAVFQTRAMGGGANGEPEFSVTLLGLSAVTGNSITPLTTAIRSNDKALGTGVGNLGRYRNPAVDALIDEAAATVDSARREALQKQAAALALNDTAIVPLLHLKAAWAMRKDLTIVPRADGFTLAMNIRPAHQP